VTNVTTTTKQNTVALTGLTHKVTPINLTSKITVNEPHQIVNVVNVKNTVQVDNQIPTISILNPNVLVSLTPSPISVTVDEDNIKVVAGGVKGPQGDKGEDGGIAANQTDTLVAPAALETIDAVIAASKRSAKWFITVTDAVNGLFAFSEVASIHNGTVARWTHYAKIGDTLDYDVAVDISIGQLVLTATNNEAVSLEFSVVRVVTNVV
jgi:hypothetical protein